MKCQLNTTVDRPKIPVEDQQKILDDLKSILLPVYHEKKETNLKSKQTDMKNIAKRKAMQTQYVIGLNSVTRHLEKNLLSLVLVCGSAHPKHMTRHIAELSAIRGCPAVSLKNLGSTLASSLNIKSCITIGFKKSTDGKCFFKDFISSVKAPEINLPFMTNYVAQHSNVLTEVNANNTSVSLPEVQHGNLKSSSKGSITKDESMELCPASSPPPSQTSSTAAKDGFSSFYVRTSVKESVKSSEQKAFDPSLNFIFLGDDDDDDDDDEADDKESLQMMLCFRNRDSNIKNTKWDEIFLPKFMPDHLWNKCDVSTKKDEVEKLQAAKDKKKIKKELSKKDKMVKKKKFKSKDITKKGQSPIEYKDTNIRRIKGNSDRKKSKKVSKKTLAIGTDCKTDGKNKEK
ncbi:Hypothetical predicted protein [Octopus vulgaris]|uniref:Ribosomal protein eL8/eL30/eS12/Gadd45 domain-containing protein n=1 Tax=Octopus vulgaris TaxID=6645 RepID=A0AA36B2L2_OCTVU|nr:Hypothetical predicted protein [Octopus vulgaris]